MIAAPVNGISATDDNSLQLGSLLGAGYGLQFVSGTEAVTLVDGTLSVGADTNEATIERLYEGLLGHAGDATGLGYWDAQMTAGTTATGVAAAFLGGAEYTAAHASLTDAQFVTSLYQGLLGRAPGSGELASGTALLTQTGSTDAAQRAQLAANIAGSAEAKTALAADTANVWAPSAAGTLVYELYQTGLNREVETGNNGEAFWISALQGGTTALQVANAIASTAEFKTDHTGQAASAFVTSLYQNALGRAADQAGAQFWTNGLQSGGMTQASVLLGIATSNEATAHLTKTV